MYRDEVYESALKQSREESVIALKSEVKSVEMLINKLLTQLLECSAISAERDFNMCGL